MLVLLALDEMLGDTQCDVNGKGVFIVWFKNTPHDQYLHKYKTLQHFDAIITYLKKLHLQTDIGCI